MMKLLIERQMRKERSDSSSADFNYFISSLDLLNSFILKFLPGLFYFILFYFVFLGPYLRHMEVPRLEVELEL